MKAPADLVITTTVDDAMINNTSSNNRTIIDGEGEEVVEIRVKTVITRIEVTIITEEVIIVDVIHRMI